MPWQDFRPVDGIMRAEGNDQIMTGVTIRSLGTVVYYNCTKAATQADLVKNKVIYIPREEGVSLGFGRIPPREDRKQPAFTIGTPREIIANLRLMEPTGYCRAPNIDKGKSGLPPPNVQ